MMRLHIVLCCWTLPRQMLKTNTALLSMQVSMNTGDAYVEFPN